MVGISEREGKEKSVRAERELRKREDIKHRAEGGGQREEGEMTAEEFWKRKEELAGQMKRIED